MGEAADAQHRTMTRRAVGRVRMVALYVAAWTPLLVVYALLVSGKSPMSTATAVTIAAQTVGAAALLGVIALWYIRRDAWRGELSPGFLARHFVASLTYGGAWTLCILSNIRAGSPSWQAVLSEARPWIGWQIFLGVVLYVVLASVFSIAASTALARDTEAQRIQADALRARAELEALRGRLDPHFLFNTLHSLSVLARHDAEQTQRALGQLADLLRYVLDSKRGAREQVTLADELSFVHAYLALEGLRFGDRLRTTTTVPDDALDHIVPSLSLQPLVENAIRHAVSPRAGGGCVDVSAQFENDYLVMSVRDDGPASHGETSGTGVGLDALRKRLALLYGPSATVKTVTSATGFAVTVRIPA
jgi:two-component system, LytTR family, sensor kinase